MLRRNDSPQLPDTAFTLVGRDRNLDLQCMRFFFGCLFAPLFTILNDFFLISRQQRDEWVRICQVLLRIASGELTMNTHGHISHAR